ncbi:MAG TPA: branched-chain amino acid ABC transporter permease [Myxococcaceae bacterium]|nr:branched-chain amino acid ABC transporter permease [Myxococcaceae bacterium]
MAGALLYGFLSAESEKAVALILLVAVLAVVGGLRSGVLATLVRGAGPGPSLVALGGAAVALVAVFHADPFVLLLMARALLVLVSCLGLHVQLADAGVPNFAGAAFFGVGGYTAAVLARGALPHPLILLASGAVAAAVGSLLLLPLLRTRGHYAALITIAFGLLFRTFLEVNETLGGPQGLKLGGLRILGWSFNEDRRLLGLDISGYAFYCLASIALVLLAVVLVRAVERSWLGVALDAVRLDETAAACFGVSIGRWKIAAFTLGNAIIGVAGGLSAMMVGFIAPNNFTFQESLVLVSILLLGGLGNLTGLAVASLIVIWLPEKLQPIQEYRYLLFSALVVLVLVLRPAGLIRRSARRPFGSVVT